MFIKIVTLSFFLSHAALAAPQVVPAPVKQLYVPAGFDSNDSVEVVVSGAFPNGCYSRNTVSVKVKDDVIKINVTALESSEKLLCPQMIIPFKEVVAIGNLQGGMYRVEVNQRLKDILIVDEAPSSSVDEHIYAAIDNVRKVGPGMFALEGLRYSTCIELDHVEVVSNNKDTVSLLPIMKQISDFCPMKMTPISYQVKVDLSSLKTAEPLIHVRTMDGKSYNKIFTQE